MGKEPSSEAIADGKTKEEETAKNVLDMLEYLEEQVMRGKEMGVEFSEVEGMIAGARIIIESGEVSDAAAIINECLQRASTRFSEHEMLVMGIRKAEMEIRAAHNAGRDVTEAGKHLRMSRIHMENGEYRLALEVVRQAVQALNGPAQANVVWGSGLEDKEST